MLSQHTNLTYDICDLGNKLQAPFCPHGPTLLFTRTNTDTGEIEKFYACGVCRSRKECNFYQSFETKETDDRRLLRKDIYKQFNAASKHYKTYTGAASVSPLFCMDCGVIVPNDLCTDKSHPFQYKELSLEEFRYPSRWLKPKESNKMNAQYFFSSDVIDFLKDTILRQKADKVLCVGVPSLHEHLRHDSAMSCVSSFLLDLDIRLRQFHPSFAQYNMFNHHFYEETEQKVYEEFVRDSKHLVVVVDPPYGGLLGALQLTLKKIVASTTGKVTTIVFLPYFMEAQMKKHLPSLVMSDYKVNYANHSGYTSEGRPRGSPARLYTDLQLNNLVLPSEEGYRYCKECQRYIAKENVHCLKCDSCTTKDGPTYKHCDHCNSCRKPTWMHCNDCGKCVQVQHSCSEDGSTKNVSNQKSSSWQPKKRKLPKNEPKQHRRLHKKKRM